jgi:ABC-2 type transport system permease protein
MRALVRMELLKLRKRRMTWIMLGLLVGLRLAGTAFSVFWSSRAGVEPEIRERIIASATLPSVISETLTFIAGLGAFLLAILTAASMGSEYGWGTLYAIIGSGVPRGRFLAAKLIALCTVAVAYTVVALLVMVSAAVPTALLLERPILTGTVDTSWLANIALMVARTVLPLLAQIAMAFAITVVTRSQAAGVGVALAASFIEPLAALVLDMLGGSLASVADYLLLVNVQALMQYNGFGNVQVPEGALSQTHAVLVILGWMVLYVTTALLVFRRRGSQHRLVAISGARAALRSRDAPPRAAAGDIGETPEAVRLRYMVKDR